MSDVLPKFSYRKTVRFQFVKYLYQRRSNVAMISVVRIPPGYFQLDKTRVRGCGRSIPKKRAYVETRFPSAAELISYELHSDRAEKTVRPPALTHFSTMSRNITIHYGRTEWSQGVKKNIEQDFIGRPT